VFATREHLANAFDAIGLNLSCYNSVRVRASTRCDALRLSLKINFFCDYKLGDRERKKFNVVCLAQKI